METEPSEVDILIRSGQYWQLVTGEVRRGESGHQSWEEVDVKQVNTVCNLGTWFETNLTMNMDIKKTCSSTFFYLYNIKRIRKDLTSESAAALVHAFITSRVDYCNSLHYGLPGYQLHKL